MQRRLLLSSLAVLATSPVWAQSSPAASDGSASPANPQTPAPAPAMKMATPLSMSEAAEKHLKDTMEVGSLSLVLSRIAEPKVKHAMLKQFAGFEIAEQETIADILKSMKMPGASPTGTVTAPTDAELMGNLDSAGKTSVEKMRAMKAGADFDKAYIKAQVEGHRKLLEIQEAYLSKPDTADETHVAKLARGMIKEHLALLADLEKSG
jgi:putative membrane protein